MQACNEGNDLHSRMLNGSPQEDHDHKHRVLRKGPKKRQFETQRKEDMKIRKPNQKRISYVFGWIEV